MGLTSSPFLGFLGLGFSVLNARYAQKAQSTYMHKDEDQHQPAHPVADVWHVVSIQVVALVQQSPAGRNGGDRRALHAGPGVCTASWLWSQGLLSLELLLAAAAPGHLDDPEREGCEVQHDQATDQRAPASKDALVARVLFHHLQQRAAAVSNVAMEQHVRRAASASA